MGIFGFSQKETGAKSVAMATTVGVILFLLWCTFVVLSFKNTALVFPEILFIQYFTIFQLQTIWCHHCSNLHNRKTSISLKRKKIFQKENRHSSVFWKAFQISRNYFSCHMHFKNSKDIGSYFSCTFINWFSLQTSINFLPCCLTCWKFFTAPYALHGPPHMCGCMS